MENYGEKYFKGHRKKLKIYMLKEKTITSQEKETPKVSSQYKTEKRVDLVE